MEKRLFFFIPICIVLMLCVAACGSSSSPSSGETSPPPLPLPPPPQSVPEAPEIPITGAVSNTTIAISWTGVRDATGYNVYLDLQARPHNPSPVTENTYTFTGLAPDTSYDIWLKAINSAGASDFSPALKIKTGMLGVVERDFFALQYSGGRNDPPTEIKVLARRIKSTTHLEIYLKSGQTMTDADVNYIAENFEKNYANLVNIYGDHTDVDNNGKIIILLYDINTGSTANDYVAGLFFSRDLLRNDPTDTDTRYSNEAEILYVESEKTQDIENIFGTVVHEFQHLINYNMNFITMGKSSDLWLNEALSESSEIVVSQALPGNRMDTYNVYSHEAIRDGNYFYDWTGALADYSTASLFMYWLYLNGGGETILKDIAQASSASRGDYQSVVDAVGTLKTTTGVFSPGDSWEDILFSWLEANENFDVGYPSGQYKRINGQGSISLTTKILNRSGTYSLRSGSAVLSTGLTQNDNLGIKRRTFISGTDTIHITLNTNTDTEASSVSVDVPTTKTRLNSVARMNVFPLLVDENYRIRHISQKPLTSEVYE